MRLILTIVIVVFLGAIKPAAAGQRVALDIGIADYPGDLRLTNPVNDASDVSAALRALGFDVLAEIDVDRRRFIEVLSSFYAKAEGAETALFYFSGHGLQIRGVNYLVPKDARFRDADQAKAEMIALQDILDAMKERTGGVKLTFLDACRNNPLSDELQRSVRGQERSSIVPRGLAPMTIGSDVNTLLVFAALAGRTAADGMPGGNSPFTRALLKHLGASGLSVADMMTAVTAEVYDATRGEQIPEMIVRIRTPFSFNPVKSDVHTTSHAKANLIPTVSLDRCKYENPPLDCYLGRR